MVGSYQHATIKEVAQLARVAPSSVSRVLSDHPDVSPAMKERVLRAAAQLGYQPDFLAQSLRSGATRSVGFIVRDISIPLFADIIKGAEQTLENHGYSTLLMNSFQDYALEAKHIGMLARRRVDGMIVSLASESNADTLRALSRVRTPVVLLDREVKGATADAVLFDHSAGSYAATKALIDLGHRRIGLIIGSLGIRPSRERLQGFFSAYESAGVLSRREDVMEVETSVPESGAKATLALLDRSSPPTAIIAGDSQLGVGMLMALNERGIRQGKDISVVVADDVALLRLMDPPVSVIHRNPEEMGRIAAELLLRRLSNVAAPPAYEVLPTRFIARGSTQNIAVS